LGTLTRALKDPRFRPYFLGVLLALPVAVVVWRLMATRSIWFTIFIVIWPLLGFVWIRGPVFKTIWIALVVGSLLGTVLLNA
jgi:uncharacterized membrane protein